MKINKISKEHIDYLKKNWSIKGNQEIADHIGKSVSQIVRYARSMGLPPKPTGGHNKIKIDGLSVEELRESRVKMQEDRDSKKMFEKLLDENISLNKKLETLVNVKDVNTYTIKKTKADSSVATAVVLASDWHVGEMVDPKTIGNINEFNEKIAKERGMEFFQNVLRLVNIFEKDIKIEKLILALLGDFISNTIHEDLAETNTMLPSDEISFAQDLIISGIKFLLDNSKLSLIIPCHSGNHGRMTQKLRTSAEAGNSLEYYMYQNIARYFDGNKRVEFLIPRGYFSYIPVYDKVLRFHHGHNIAYNGGVGGITVPINKAIAQWNRNVNVDLDCFGHFHQMFDGGYWICNGSLIGYNNYAERIKASFEKPKQVFFLMDAKRGKTMVTPITFNK
jgi:hypothetical protein